MIFISSSFLVHCCPVDSVHAGFVMAVWGTLFVTVWKSSLDKGFSMFNPTHITEPRIHGANPNGWKWQGLQYIDRNDPGPSYAKFVEKEK